MWSFNLLLFWGYCGIFIWVMFSLESMAVDVNECADTTTCPAYAKCIDTSDSYYCTCKRGFLSSNGMEHFKDPGVTCIDIDECSQSPPPCGPNSVCENLLGRYKCSCSPGFSSPTGNKWISGNPGRFICTDINECLSRGVCQEHAECINTLGSYKCRCQVGFIAHNSICEDVDECADPRTCPEHATCHNSPGSYSCVCNVGFESSGGKKRLLGSREICGDVDECARNSTICGLNSVCTNILGGYNCSCLPGYFSPAVWTPEKPEDFICTDIDECSQDPSPCGPNSVCTNTLGSYSCSCIEGFRPNPGGSLNFTCKRIPFKCKEDVIPDNEWVQLCQVGASVELEHGSFCTLMNATFNILDNACENRSTVVSLKSMVESFASVLQQTSTSNFTKEETSALATVVLESVKSTTLATFLKPSANVSQTIQTEQLEMESKIIKEECIEENMTFHFKAKGDEMKIGCSTIEESKSTGEITGTTGVAFVSFLGMESFLDESFFQDQQMPSAISQRMVKINSRVVQGIMTGEKKDGFSDPIIYTLENIKPKQEFERPICVSWDTNVEGGRWTSSGCVVLEASETHTVCSCNQMVNLAIIMAYGELTMDFSLYIISHVGMIISLVCLVLAIITFILCRSIQNHNTYLHLHLCVCLFLAKALFLTGVDKTHNKVSHPSGCVFTQPHHLHISPPILLNNLYSNSYLRTFACAMPSFDNIYSQFFTWLTSFVIGLSLKSFP